MFVTGFGIISAAGREALSALEFKDPCLAALTRGEVCEVKAIIPVIEGSRKNSVLLIYQGGLYSFSEDYLDILKNVIAGWLYQ